jgi:hypothetical protein
VGYKKPGSLSASLHRHGRACPGPAISRGTLPYRWSRRTWTSPAMTVQPGFIQSGSADGRCEFAMTPISAITGCPAPLTFAELYGVFRYLGHN